HWCGPQTTYSEKTHRLVWKGELSPEQKRASQTVGEAVGKGGELLIWAVCGAGKTEVLFEGIEKALTEGMNVCLASPRTDVITELAPRLREAFPDTGVIALYGGSKDRGKHAQLVLATTHQLFRYREAFDLVVIDEVDAFPFDSDKSLAHAVEKAKKPEASTVYLTATPDAEMKRRFLDKRMAGVKIPIRYHRRPLPVPVFRWIGHWKKALARQKLPDAVRHWAVRQCESGRPAFLFVPSIDVMERVVRLLRHVDERIIGVYSGDGERREKVERFRRGEIPIIVTTTILERGVTVPNVDAAVFGADDDVFSERALVQMAGRVGRSAEAPDGDAVFFHYGKTKAMAAARRHIESMNREAFADKGR
ncbi:MAG TPA: helicase-related protein, partial [Bacillales bacterium]|nr:helicase-related protein [Bacillales bacterium]